MLGVCFFLGTGGVTLGAILAALGFAHPALDAFNHLQPVWFVGTLLALLLAPVFVRLPRLRALTTAIAATGFLASAVIVVPEAAANLAPRPPLPADGRPVYRLLSHNLFGANYEFDDILRSIAEAKPDIIALQEYFGGQRRGLHDELVKTYPYFSVCRGGKRANIAIYSRINFAATQEGACTDSEDDRISRIIAKFAPDSGAPFTVVTTHLDWPVQVSQFERGRTLRESIDLAYARKQEQFNSLADALKTVPGPLLLVGDFNSTSWSHKLRRFTEVTGLTRQDHSLFTWPRRFYIWGWRNVWPPFLPLDHVMTRGGVEVHEVEATEPAGSDHEGVLTVFSVPEQQIAGSNP